jgi:hypothetical protein
MRYENRTVYLIDYPAFQFKWLYVLQCCSGLRGNANAALWMHGVGEDGPDDGKWHPQYYLLLPLTVPGDVVASPVQLFMGAKLMFGDWHT